MLRRPQRARVAISECTSRIPVVSLNLHMCCSRDWVSAHTHLIPFSTRSKTEVIATINGMKLSKAYSYLEKVQERKQCIPFRRFNGGVGRTPQASAFGTTQGEWTMVLKS